MLCVASSSSSSSHRARTVPPLHAPALQRGSPAMTMEDRKSSSQLHQQQSGPSNNKSKGLDSQLWHACAGGMVQLPPVGAKVIYFPQGHGEQASPGIIDFPRGLGPAGTVPCRVVSVDFLADAETDEVYARLKLQPEPFYGDEQLPSGAALQADKPASFAKTLTQSDANNGGGFSVPRYCAETIFPRLDYSVDPPVQTVLAKDVHGELWKFRHIYRGTPRRHLLTTGWSTFVNQKKLVAGDAIVFLRSATGELCVGVRRSMRGPGSAGESCVSWHSSPGSADGRNSTRWEYKTSDAGGYSELCGSGRSGATNFTRNRARVSSKSVLEAASLAAGGQAFEVLYYPRASTAEFCVRAGLVKASLEHSWYPGMRFKMAFETEDSSRISWFMGTIAAVQPADPLRWPSSPWRILQVTWDEPDLLQGVNRVSPWQVELVSTLPMQLPPFSLPRKKFRASQPLELQFGEGQGAFGLPVASLASSMLGQLNPWQSLSEDFPAGMQGARQERFSGLSFPEFQHKQRFLPAAGLALDGLHHPLQQHSTCGVDGRGGAIDLRLNSFAPYDYFQMQNNNAGGNNVNGNKNSSSTNLFVVNNSCMDRSHNAVAAAAPPPPTDVPRKRSATFLLFGKSIDPNEVGDNAGNGDKVNSPPRQPSSNSSFGDSQTENSSKQQQQQLDLRLCQGGSSPDSGVTNEFGTSSFKFIKEQNLLSLSSDKDDTGVAAANDDDKSSDDNKNVIHCKIFFENEEVGRTLDLSHYETYDEVYDKLAIMFTVDKSKLSGRVVYKDVEGSTIHMGGEPYRNFMNSVRRLTILALPSSSSSGSRSAQSW